MSVSSTYMPNRIHHGSLIPLSQHHPDLVWLMGQRVTSEMVDCIVSKTRSVIGLDTDYCSPVQKLLPGHSALPSPPVTPTKPGFQLGKNSAPCLPSLEKFLQSLINSSRIQVPTLLCTLIYLDRISPKLPPVSHGSQSNSRLPCTRHRVLLATIICSAKYLNDSSPKNKHWAAYSSALFQCDEVNLMEQQLLSLLDWDLRLTEEECVRAFSMFFKPLMASRIAHPPTPPYEESGIRPAGATTAPRSGSRLNVPADRRASRPARIDLSKGPAHLLPSYSRSNPSGAPLSPPPTAAKELFSVPQVPSHHHESEVSGVISASRSANSQDWRRKNEMVDTAEHRYATYSHLPTGRRDPSNLKPSYIADPEGSSQSSELLDDNATQDDGIGSTVSWPSLSRANELLERVWGGSQTGRTGVAKSSRSVGGIFRSAQSEGASGRNATRV